MSGIVWDIPSEQALQRIEDLETYISNFPNSPLVPAMKDEIEILKRGI